VQFIYSSPSRAFFDFAIISLLGFSLSIALSAEEGRKTVEEVPAKVYLQLAWPAIKIVLRDYDQEYIKLHDPPIASETGRDSGLGFLYVAPDVGMRFKVGENFSFSIGYRLIWDNIHAHMITISPLYVCVYFFCYEGSWAFLVGYTIFDKIILGKQPLLVLHTLGACEAFHWCLFKFGILQEIRSVSSLLSFSSVSLLYLSIFEINFEL
jgi:hypothetical protein